MFSYNDLTIPLPGRLKTSTGVFEILVVVDNFCKIGDGVNTIVVF